ncbi:MAG: D-tyrosyl-tRNA(Tyr) deacylase [Rhabdochlamydiaceae bacterium]|nr:D-tyrosyl-tRNA(Tyr) deacylase [Rhabdochlamydiaceae bacterium]
MRILVQRVSKASVEVEEKVVGAVGKGALVLVGITHDDTMEEVVWLANKFVSLRLFGRGEDGFQDSIVECGGEVLIVSQFTLYADCLSGRRPSFTKAAAPSMAKELYEQFICEVQKKGIFVQTGVFGAKMSVSLVNEGPVTILLERNHS